MKKCPICNKSYKDEDIDSFHLHIETDHADVIPKNWNGARYMFYVNHGRGNGKCRICGGKTDWNYSTNRPYVLCNNPKCKKLYREMFVNNMKKKYGKEHLLDSPEMQKKMLMNRSISGEYRWSDGVKIPYVGSYEKDFLQFLDVFLNFESKDIHAPAPQIFDYSTEEDGKKVQHFYIPDFYIESLNTIVEIKDGGSNPNTHHKILAVDKVKEKIKDDVMKKQKEYNYIKVTDKKYGSFMKFLFQLKIKDDYKNKKIRPTVIINEQANLLMENIDCNKMNLIIILYLNNSGLVECAFTTDINCNLLYKYNPIEKSIDTIKKDTINNDCEIFMIKNDTLGNDNLVKILSVLSNINDPKYKEYLIDDSLFFIFNIINKESKQEFFDDNENLIYNIKYSDNLISLYSSNDISNFDFNKSIEALTEQCSVLLESRYKNYLKEQVLLNEEVEENSIVIFGIDKYKEYLMKDSESILYVINHFDECDEEYKPELARNIEKALLTFNLDDTIIKDNIKSYLDEDLISPVPVIEKNKIDNTFKNFELSNFEIMIKNADNEIKKEICLIHLNKLLSNGRIDSVQYENYRNEILM